MNRIGSLNLINSDTTIEEEEEAEEKDEEEYEEGEIIKEDEKKIREELIGENGSRYEKTSS